jgi:DNA-binding response OmpR family regulator
MAYKLLVVDDEKEVVGFLMRMLMAEGYEAVSAYDGEEALVKIKETDPDIILLDLMLPKKNGFEVLREIRQSYRDRWRPVIIISGKSDLDSMKKGYDMDADHYLIKPIERGVLLRGITTMISLLPLRRGYGNQEE